MSEFLELRQVVSALIGAVLALLGQALVRKGARARTARKLCIAFGEELEAVNFYGPPDMPNFAGFSSQTFDSLFKEIAESLPESLARALMRYHWRMKYMEEMKSVTIPSSGGVQPKFWAEMKDLHRSLLGRLKHHSDRSWISIFFRSGETCPKALLEGGDAQDAS
jgi:hypothetical protein